MQGWDFAGFTEPLRLKVIAKATLAIAMTIIIRMNRAVRFISDALRYAARALSVSSFRYQLSLCRFT